MVLAVAHTSAVFSAVFHRPATFLPRQNCCAPDRNGFSSDFCSFWESCPDIYFRTKKQNLEASLLRGFASSVRKLLFYQFLEFLRGYLAGLRSFKKLFCKGYPFSELLFGIGSVVQISTLSGVMCLVCGTVYSQKIVVVYLHLIIKLPTHLSARLHTAAVLLIASVEGNKIFAAVFAFSDMHIH